uniref:Uncharacterized protein n=1 Tax=Candidatus Kentrum sp. MB TaxID=2138164 RepID=A0A450X7X3_9GAMM|nr:MAG: hypothetical protein BECKMB1821G_GA0114241_101315 [Candidatus Kentron sp. MB]
MWRDSIVEKIHKIRRSFSFGIFGHNTPEYASNMPGSSITMWMRFVRIYKSSKPIAGVNWSFPALRSEPAKCNHSEVRVGIP